MTAKRLLQALALLLVGFQVSGCAAIVASKTDTLSVNSNPQGAEVRLNGNPAGKTPTSVQITRKAPETVEVVLPGHESQKCPVNMTPGGGYIAGDVLFCVLLFPIGCISWIDAAGDWNTLVSPNCLVTLPPKDGTPVPVPVPAAKPATPPSASLGNDRERARG